jgi:hypothetical protein
MDARERYLNRQRKYNQSKKGQARYKRYEDAHPERAGNRWEPARNTRQSISTPAADGGPEYEWYKELMYDD